MAWSGYAHLSRLKATMIWWAWFVAAMCLWRNAVALAPVSSITRFISAHAQSPVEHSARVHSATLLECAMCLTNGLLTPPFTWGCAKVVPSPWGVVCCHQHHPTRIE